MSRPNCVDPYPFLSRSLRETHDKSHLNNRTGNDAGSVVCRAVPWRHLHVTHQSTKRRRQLQGVKRPLHGQAGLPASRRSANEIAQSRSHCHADEFAIIDRVQHRRLVGQHIVPPVVEHVKRNVVTRLGHDFVPCGEQRPGSLLICSDARPFYVPAFGPPSQAWHPQTQPPAQQREGQAVPRLPTRSRRSPPQTPGQSTRWTRHSQSKQQSPVSKKTLRWKRCAARKHRRCRDTYVGAVSSSAHGTLAHAHPRTTRPPPQLRSGGQVSVSSRSPQNVLTVTDSIPGR